MAKKKSAAKPAAKGKTRAKAKNLAPKSAGKVKGGVISGSYVTRPSTSTSIIKTTLPTKLYE